MGNKCDLEKERQVSKEDAEKFAELNGLIFLETSAKEAKKIFEVFKITNDGNNPNNKGNKKKKCC